VQDTGQVFGYLRDPVPGRILDLIYTDASDQRARQLLYARPLPKKSVLLICGEPLPKELDPYRQIRYTLVLVDDYYQCQDTRRQCFGSLVLPRKSSRPLNLCYSESMSSSKALRLNTDGFASQANLTHAQLTELLTRLRHHYGEKINDAMLARALGLPEKEITRRLGRDTGKPDWEVRKEEFVRLVREHWPTETVPTLAAQAGISRETGYRLLQVISAEERQKLLARRAYDKALKDILRFFREAKKPLTDHHLSRWDKRAYKRIVYVMPVTAWRKNLSLPTDLYTRLED
jgi:hypothetical protein